MLSDVAVILAGGKGTRFGAKKQYLKLGGKCIWRYVYDTATKCFAIDNIMVVGVDIEGGLTRSGSVIICMDSNSLFDIN